MPEVQGRGSRFAGVENRGLQRLTHDEASARVHSTSRERSLQHKGRINGGAEWVPPLDRTACEPDLPLRVSRRSRSRATRHFRHDAGNELRRPVLIPANQRAPTSTCSGYEAVASLQSRLGPDELVHVIRQRHVRGSVRCGQRETSARKTACRRPAAEPSPEGRFSARRPRHRVSDMTLLNVPLITHRPTPNAQGPTRNPQRCQVERLEVAS